jgi:hypothetical protein
MDTSAGWINQGHPEKAWQLKLWQLSREPRNRCTDMENRDATKLVGIAG